MSNTPFVALAFPSFSASSSDVSKDSKRKADHFGQTYGLSESVKVLKDTYGFLVPASSDPRLFDQAKSYGARIVSVSGTKTESTVTPQGHKNSQGIENGGAAPKASDGAHSYTSKPAAKVKAGNYGKTKTIGEGQWIKIADKVEGTRIEMAGTNPIGSEWGELKPGDYYVLGMQEAVDDTVVTLGKVSSLAKLGSTNEGRYVFNVRLSDIAEDDPSKTSSANTDFGKVRGARGDKDIQDGPATPDPDKMKAKKKVAGLAQEGDDAAKAAFSDGGILPSKKKEVARAEKTKGSRKEGILGAGMVTAQTPVRESENRLTESGPHSRAIRDVKILKAMGVIPQGSRMTESKPAHKNLAPMTESAAPGQDLGGPLTGGVFSTDLDPNVSAMMDAFQAQSMVGGSVRVPAGSVNESQARAAMGGAESVDIDSYLAQLEATLEDPDLTDEERTAIETFLASNKEEPQEEDDDFDVDAEEEDTQEESEDIEDLPELEELPDEDAKFEDVLPGDMGKLGGLAGLLKSRGIANPEKVAAKIESGHPAEEWFGMAGMSLQDAKRLCWLHTAHKSGQ